MESASPCLMSGGLWIFCVAIATPEENMIAGKEDLKLDAEGSGSFVLAVRC